MGHGRLGALLENLIPSNNCSSQNIYNNYYGSGKTTNSLDRFPAILYLLSKDSHDPSTLDHVSRYIQQDAWFGLARVTNVTCMVKETPNLTLE
jgi:hypothetical protein